jgi:sugar lactone lactonase YvrE
MNRTRFFLGLNSIWSGAAVVLSLLSLSAAAQTGPTITQQPASQAVAPGSAVTLTVGVAGTGPFTYQWQFDGTNLPNGIITTVAGNGSSATSGDGGPATSAGLSYPAGLAVDSFGNLFIADSGNNRIRKVDTNGIITTVAGTGAAGYSGDSGPATSATLYNPVGISVDSAGNLFIADYDNQVVRRVDTNGKISTVAGKGSSGYSGDGTFATNASLASPTDVAVDAFGDIFIADSSNERIREVASNGIISTVAGTGAGGSSGDGGPAIDALFNAPAMLAFDAHGKLFIVDQQNQKIRVMSTNGIINTFAGKGANGYSGDGGPATNATFNVPLGIALDPLGIVFIADLDNNRVRQVDLDGFITTVAGNGTGGFSGDGGTATNSHLNSPYSVAADAFGDLFFGDAGNSRVRKVNLLGGKPSLPLRAVSAANAGQYRVIVTNPYGSATSAVATLTMSIPAENPATATASPEVVNGFVVGATITFPGAGYTNAPEVSIVGGNGSGATATSSISNGVVVAITIVNPGSGYTGTPAIVIEPPPYPPTQAVGIAVVINGFVTGVDITVQGYGYGTNNPPVYFFGGGGSGATGVAVVSNGVLTGVTITSPGSGYTNAPDVLIAAPQGAASLSIAVYSVVVNMALIPGYTYQLQSTTDFTTWSDVGGPFLATNSLSSQVFNVSSNAVYYRLEQAP